MMHTRVPLPHVEARACRDLWSAVLLSVVRDLCNPGARSRERSEAERWIGDWPSRDFQIVCHLTGIEPDWLHKALSQLMALPVAERRHALAARLNCQPGQIGGCLMVRQTAFEEQRDDARNKPEDVQPGSIHKTCTVPISMEVRRNRVAAMFRQGVTPTDISHAFAVQGHVVSMATLWNDIRVLRGSGRIGYARAQDSTGEPIHHIQEEKL